MFCFLGWISTAGAMAQKIVKKCLWVPTLMEPAVEVELWLWCLCVFGDHRGRIPVSMQCGFLPIVRCIPTELPQTLPRSCWLFEVMGSPTPTQALPCHVECSLLISELLALPTHPCPALVSWSRNSSLTPTLDCFIHVFTLLGCKLILKKLKMR